MVRFIIFSAVAIAGSFGLAYMWQDEIPAVVEAFASNTEFALFIISYIVFGGVMGMIAVSLRE